MVLPYNHAPDITTDVSENVFFCLSFLAEVIDSNRISSISTGVAYCKFHVDIEAAEEAPQLQIESTVNTVHIEP